MQELYGNVTAGNLLSVLSRLWTHFLQANGFTCGIGDLLLKPTAESARAAYGGGKELPERIGS